MVHDTGDRPVSGSATDGLTSEEVAARIARGQVNTAASKGTRTIPQIISSHLFTLFNGVNLVLAALVFTTGEYQNMLFVGVVVSNLVIGVFQEIRAKRLVDKLQVVTAQQVEVIRDGKRTELGVEELVIDDLIILGRGDQVPADSIVVSGVGTVNESLLTGESDAVQKTEGSELYSGSFVDSGSLICRVCQVGSEGYAAKLSAEARRPKTVASEMRRAIDCVIEVATFLLVPLGTILFIRIFTTGDYSWQQAVLQTVSAVVGMIPQGLVLLVSSVLAIATTRLARRQILVQQSYCVETLARVDMLCLDKTGTITTGEMEVSEARATVDWQELLRAAASICAATSKELNETGQAIATWCDDMDAKAVSIAQGVPFSSSTKCSGCITTAGEAYVMGAAQFVLGKDWKDVEEQVRSFGATARVMVVCRCSGFDRGGRPQGERQVLGYLALRDRMRPTAAKTMEYFKSQGVSICVISGDDPVTVSAVASQAGIEGADHYVDASQLDTPEALECAARQCRVFGRVTPEIKRDLIAALKAQGHTVAMCGDGVNDVLALRESDCSVAMASGAAAARNVSDIVLVDDDFAHMPEVVAEGRRSINNLQRSAALFLTKTVYSAAIAIVSIFVPPYPFIPIQMTLISTSVIGIPSFVLALEPNHERVHGDFLSNVLLRSLPASLAAIVSIALAMICSCLLGWDSSELSTVCTVLLALVGLILVWRVSRPMTILRRALMVFCATIVILGCTVFGWFFELASFTFQTELCAIAGSACAIACFMWADRRLSEPDGRAAIARAAQRLEGIHDHGCKASRGHCDSQETA